MFSNGLSRTDGSLEGEGTTGGVGPVSFRDWCLPGTVGEGEAYLAYRAYCSAFGKVAEVFFPVGGPWCGTGRFGKCSGVDDGQFVDSSSVVGCERRCGGGVGSGCWRSVEHSGESGGVVDTLGFCARADGGTGRGSVSGDGRVPVSGLRGGESRAGDTERLEQRDVDPERVDVGGVLGSGDASRSSSVGSVAGVGCESGVGGPEAVLVQSGRNRRRCARRRRLREAGRPVVSGGSGGSVAAGEVSSSGFFSECSKTVRSELRESRARRLIAENLAAEASALRRRKYVESAVAYAQDLTRGMRVVKSLGVAGQGTAVSGWVETVVGSVAETLARSAPSTVPSLESVGFGASSLESSSGVKEKDVVVSRLEEYQAKEAEIRAYFDSLEMVSLDEVETAVRQLQGEYADVLLSPKELARRELEEKVICGVVQLDLSMEQRMKVVELVSL